MLLDLLIILGACVVGVFFGLLVYWMIVRILKTRRGNISNSIEGERESTFTMAEEFDQPSLEKALKREADTEPEHEGWLNKGVPEASLSTLHKDDDDWLNAGIEDVSTEGYQQQDEDRLNAKNNHSLETMKESSLNSANTSRPEIQIKQDGSILNIKVTKVTEKDKKPEQTVINLRINTSSQNSTRKGEGLYDVEIIPSFASLRDITKVEPVDESINQSHSLMDEISVRTLESPDIERHDSDI